MVTVTVAVAVTVWVRGVYIIALHKLLAPDTGSLPSPDLAPTHVGFALYVGACFQQQLSNLDLPIFGGGVERRAASLCE